MILALGLAGALLLSGDTIRNSSLDSLADETTTQIGRFADRQVAIAEGYRRIGADFPGMGEHWLRPGSLFSQRLDASRPTILIYAAIGGRVALLGAGYVITTNAASAPAVVPGWPEAWHEHSGLLGDESGADPSRPNTADGATRVWVLHVWTSLPNPSGRFTPDNWSLPFVRAGLEAPREADHESGRALSLAVGNGDGFLRQVLTDAALRNETNASSVDALISAERGRASAIAIEALMRGSASDAQRQALRETWRSLGEGLRLLLGPAVERLLAPPHQAHEPRGR